MCIISCTYSQALLFYLPRMLWLTMEGGLMKFLVRNAREKIIEDAEEKRDNLIQTFQVICPVFKPSHTVIHPPTRPD